MRTTRNAGMIVLGIYLILSGLFPLLRFAPAGLGYLMPLLAIIAGILIIIGR